MNLKPLNLALPTLSVESFGISILFLSPIITYSMLPLRLMRIPICLEISVEMLEMDWAMSEVMIAVGSTLFL